METTRKVNVPQFFLALFVPFATNRGTVAAGLLSLLTAILIAFFGIFGIFKQVPVTCRFNKCHIAQFILQ